MPLHPDLEAFLELVNAAGEDTRAMYRMTAAQARAAYDRSTLALDEPGPDVPCEPLAITCRDGHAMAARLYRGASGTPSPVLLYFHGGGYVLGGLDSHDSLCRSLAEGAGCAVLSVDYRRAPESRFPTAFHDAEDAAVHLAGHAAGLGLDGRRVAFGGDSVGATLATALTLAARDAGRAQPLLQLLLYPCTAARQDTASHHRLASGHLLEGRNLQWMFAQYLRSEADRDDWRFAPLQAADLRGLAPAHIALAEYDPLVDEGRAYAARLQAAGVPATVKVHAGMVHDFARLGLVVEEAGLLRAELSRALSTAFQGRDAPVH